MEDGSSEEGARTKEPRKEGDPADFDTFLVDAKAVLLKDEISMLATALEFKPAELDKVERSEDSGYMFLHLLKRKGIISRTDVSVLTDKLKFCGLHGVADDVNECFRRYQSKLLPKETDNSGKKAQLVTELRNKYRNLCGEIQPAPFLRERYDVDKLFVDSGIEFLEKEGLSSKEEIWTKLTKYEMVFTDPRVKSKRRILDGGPGYGKSTLALQITNDWCHGQAHIKDFEILILLRLRQLKNTPTIYSAIKRFLLPKDSKLTDADIESILESSSTLLLLDGFDEYPDKEKEGTDIQLIIRGEMCLEHEVIVTTRTSCLPPRYSRDTKRMRLNGFDRASRDTYIENVVSRGCPDDAARISHFFKVNPVPFDLCIIPLFFTMISYMFQKSERFRECNNVTQVFRHVIKCFHSHLEIKMADGLGLKFDHSKLDEVAFDGLSDNVQKISWDKNKLISKIGKDLYETSVNIGLLIEEESFDYDNLEYLTETRFFHKIFAEWYAAHHLAAVAARPNTEMGPWPKTEIEIALDFVNELTDTLQPEQVTRHENAHLLKSLNPFDVHYLYRYACGLNPVAAQKIITHMGTKKMYDLFTILCIVEWGGSLEVIKETISSLCSREIHFGYADSLMMQKATTELLEFAISRKIPVKSVSLNDCLINRSSTGQLCVAPSTRSLPVFDFTLHYLNIVETGREILESECDNIFRYAAKCIGLKKLQFSRCLVPRFIKVTETVSILRSRNLTVAWWFGRGYYTLNFESNQWESAFTGAAMTDEKEYQKALEDVGNWAKNRKLHIGKD